MYSMLLTVTADVAVLSKGMDICQRFIPSATAASSDIWFVTAVFS